MILNNVTILKQGRLVKTDVYFEDDEIKTIKNGLAKDEDCSNLFLMPGLRNAHVHLSTYGYKGTAIGMKKFDYFNKYWFKAKKKRKERQVYKDTIQAIKDSLALGITHFDTMDTAIEPVVKALEETSVSYTACIPLKDSYTEAGDLNDQLNKTMKLHDKYGDKIIVGIANELESTPHLIRDAFEFAKNHDLPIHMHACETKKEVRHIRKLTGKRTIEYLDSIGILDYDIKLAHCTYANSEDILRLSNTITPVLHCPTSNKAISDNEAPVKHMLRNQVPLMIGTDSFAWNPNPSVLSEAWESATLTGATPLQAYQMTHNPLEEGSKASFSLINMNQLEPYNNVNQLITKLMNNQPIKKVYLKGRLLKETIN